MPPWRSVEGAVYIAKLSISKQGGESVCECCPSGRIKDLQEGRSIEKKGSLKRKRRGRPEHTGERSAARRRRPLLDSFPLPLRCLIVAGAFTGEKQGRRIIVMEPWRSRGVCLRPSMMERRNCGPHISRHLSAMATQTGKRDD